MRDTFRSVALTTIEGYSLDDKRRKVRLRKMKHAWLRQMDDNRGMDALMISGSNAEIARPYKVPEMQQWGVTANANAEIEASR